VVILSPTITGAFDYVRQLRAEHPNLGVVAAAERDADLIIVRREVDAVRAKPDIPSGASAPEWRRTVRRVYSRRAQNPEKKASAHKGH